MRPFEPRAKRQILTARALPGIDESIVMAAGIPFAGEI
jgi:hypothetical protein